MSLSAAGTQILELNHPTAYSALVVERPGSSDSAKLLQSLLPEDLLTGNVTGADEARCALAALWLWHDHLDRAHAIVQDVYSSTGSFWHAILHRRDGDFSNSRYWYARAAGHPVLAKLDSISLLDRVARSDVRGDERLVELQRQEWRLLFDHCVRAATS
jgi:hypothetical protein